MIDIPRDTCWGGDKINVGNTQGPRAQANDVGGLSACRSRTSSTSTSRASPRLVDGVGGVDVNVPTHDARLVLRARTSPRASNAHERRRRRCAFSRDRHDFPTSDIVRTHNQGILILDAMRAAPGEACRARRASSSCSRCSAATRSSTASGIKDLYRLGRVAFSLDPDQIQNITIPSRAGGASALGGGADGLFADFRDDAIVESH